MSLLGVISSSGASGGSWIDNSLIAYYRFNNDATDSFSTHNGITTGVTYSAGKSGQASHTAKVANTGIVVPSSSAFSFGDGITDVPYSVSFYINFDTMNSVYQGWIVARREFSASNLEYQILVYNGVFYFVQFSELGSANYLELSYTVNGVLSASTWYHMILTYDGSGTPAGLNMYIDNGASIGTVIETGTYVAMDVSTADLTISQVEYNNTFSLDGLVDGLAFWNKVLSSAERTEIFNTQNGGSELY